MKAVQEFSHDQLLHARSMTTEQIVQFLDDFRVLHGARAMAQGKSTQVNVRIPEALLRAFRARAAALGVPYQTQIKRLMEEWVGQPSASTREGTHDLAAQLRRRIAADGLPRGPAAEELIRQDRDDPDR